MFVYGIRSNIPFSLHKHYFLADIDTKQVSESTVLLDKHGIKIYWLEKTPLGWHVYSFTKFRFEELVHLLPLIPQIDKSWLQIGLNTGYWFLWTRKPLPLNILDHFNVRFMRLSIPEVNPWLTTKLQNGSMRK